MSNDTEIKTYWNGNGLHTELIAKLNELIPNLGQVDEPRKNRKLEKFRKASNCYYDLYNNGLGNKRAEFRTVFGFPSRDGVDAYNNITVAFKLKVEERFNEILIDAYNEQLNPNN